MPLGLCSDFANLRSSSGFDTDTKLHTELAPMQDDAFTEWLSRCVVGSERPVDVMVI